MHYKLYKAILSPKNGMNIYRGCTHGCIYCDSRSKCYHMDHDFDDIEVKENCLNILESELKAKKNPCMIGTGSMTDPYMPIEKELMLTRNALKLIDKYNFGASVLTKSDLVLRDIDILKNINKKSKAIVQITLTTLDDNLCKIIEPYTSVASKRVEVLKRCMEEGIKTIVWLTPILPFINDTKENIMSIIDICDKYKVYGIINFSFGLTLREGNREYFYKKLDEHFPLLKEKYIRIYGLSYECNSLNNNELRKIFISECEKRNIIYDNDKLFNYMNEYPSKQLSLFDME